jgi:starvation-inducible DNA-binding protein
MEETIMKNIELVNKYLANLSVWNVKLHNLHFNVVGPQFKSIHEYLESVYDEAFEYYDAVAEAVKMRGQFPVVNVSEYLKISNIEELGAESIRQEKAVEILLSDIKLMRDIAVELRAGADEEGDFGFVSLLEDQIAYYVKQIWFIESMLA